MIPGWPSEYTQQLQFSNLDLLSFELFLGPSMGIQSRAHNTISCVNAPIKCYFIFINMLIDIMHLYKAFQHIYMTLRSYRLYIHNTYQFVHFLFHIV